MGLEAFMPSGLSQVLTVATTATPAIRLPNPAAGVRIETDSQVYFAIGSTAGSSDLAATIPTSSTPANGIRMMATSVEVFNVGPNAYISFISTATASVSLTPGNGV
jgi:hypothetical protein